MIRLPDLTVTKEVHIKPRKCIEWYINVRLKKTSMERKQITKRAMNKERV